MSHETLTGLSILLSFQSFAWKSETGKNGQEGRSRFLRWVCFSSGWNGPHLPSPGKSSPPKAEVGVSCRVLRITLSPVFQNSASLKSRLKMHVWQTWKGYWWLLKLPDARRKGHPTVCLIVAAGIELGGNRRKPWQYRERWGDNFCNLEIAMEIRKSLFYPREESKIRVFIKSPGKWFLYTLTFWWTPLLKA